VTAAAHLPPALADKLAKVLGMLGSAHDGEVAAAGRRADAMVKGAGLTRIAAKVEAFARASGEWA
jgi:hypothetical protein